MSGHVALDIFFAYEREAREMDANEIRASVERTLVAEQEGPRESCLLNFCNEPAADGFYLVPPPVELPPCATIDLIDDCLALLAHTEVKPGMASHLLWEAIVIPIEF